MSMMMSWFSRGNNPANNNKGWLANLKMKMKMGRSNWKLEDKPEMEKGLEDLHKVNIVLFPVAFAVVPLLYIPKDPAHPCHLLNPEKIEPVVIFFSVCSLYLILFSIMLEMGERRCLSGDAVTRVSREGRFSRRRVGLSCYTSSLGYCFVVINYFLLIPLKLGGPECRPAAAMLLLLWFAVAPYGGYRCYMPLTSSLLGAYTARPSMVESAKERVKAWWFQRRGGARRVVVV